jgi:catechol 2,3-dioxygenase-like lactoylglutathione lyase family enzyme
VHSRSNARDPLLATAFLAQRRDAAAKGFSRSGMGPWTGCVRAAVADVTEIRVALTVADFDEALAFYRDGLGLEQLADWSSETGRVVLLGAARATLELLDEPQAETVDAIEAGRRVSGTVRLALEVADSEEAARRLVAAGAEQVAPPVTTPWGDRNARVRAPDGMQLTLFTAE